MPPPDRFYLAFAHKCITSTTLELHSQGSGFPLLAQPSLFREPLSRSNQRDSEACQAFYSYPGCNLSLVRLFHLSFSLPVFGRIFCFLANTTINLQPSSHTVLYQAPGSSAAELQFFPMMPNTQRSSATRSVHFFSFPPGPRCPAIPSSPSILLLGNLWSPMRSSVPAYNNSLLVRTVASML